MLKPDFGPPFIVIDHHPIRKASYKAEFHDVRPTYGATSTIMTEYIAAADLTPTRSLANALLYGLKTDTQSLARTSCARADLDAFNFLSPLTNPRVIGGIERPPLTHQYFKDFHRGLSNTMLYRDVAVSYVGPIDSEAIVPELADLLLRIEGVSWSLCMGDIGNVMLLSLRSTSRTYRAGLIIRRLVGDIGSAGGHREMAGGQISLSGLTKSEKKELPSKLVARFLKLIKREKVGYKPLVNTVEPHEANSIR